MLKILKLWFVHILITLFAARPAFLSDFIALNFTEPVLRFLISYTSPVDALVTIS